MTFPFPSHPPSGAIWQTTFAQAQSSGTSNSFTTCTCRLLIPQSALSLTGGTQVRVTFSAGASQLDINQAYIQQAAAGYSAGSPAFNATPVQLLVSAGASFSIGAGSTVLTDAATLAIPAANGLCVSFYISTANGDLPYSNAGPASGLISYRPISDAATISASSYTNGTGAAGLGSALSWVISKVEVFK